MSSVSMSHKKEINPGNEDLISRKKRFQGMGVAEVRRLRVLEEENRKLKQLVADLSPDKQIL